MTTPTLTGLLKIGEVSTRSSLPIKTIRYYEEVGLLTPTVHRSEANYRMFEATVLDRLTFIKRSQALGLSLREIQTILAVHDQGHLPCPEIKQNLQQKVQQITAQIESLRSLQSELQTLLSHWQDQPAPELVAHTVCPNLISK
jgi:MerR family transcriptional regulator, copper efflux regulator